VFCAGAGSVPGDTFDLAHTEVPYDLQVALTDATGNFEQMNFESFGEAMGILGQRAKGLPPLIPEVMDNLNGLSSVVGERREQIGSLLKTAETVTNTLRGQAGGDRQPGQSGKLADRRIRRTP
jgi:ABC-type transporter Mla subunit MlaD